MGQTNSRSKATSTGTDDDFGEEWIRSIQEAGIGMGRDHPDNREYKYGDPSEKLNERQLAALRAFIQERERLGIDGLVSEFEREIMNWEPWTARNNIGDYAKAHLRNIEKNRWPTICCLDETRVVLRAPDRAYDYINANFVQNTKIVCSPQGMIRPNDPGYSVSQARTPKAPVPPRRPGDDAPFLNKYICAMAPIKSTIEDFWEMVVQEHVAYIFMLCGLSSESCEEYFPTELEQAMNFGDIRVKCKEIDSTSDPTLLMMKLSVKSKTDKFKRIMVHHYRWLNWTEFGTIPISAKPALQLLKLSRASFLNTLIHCSTGSGRTGTLITAEYVIELIMQGKKVDLVKVVKDIRRQRAHVIMSGMEYCYVVLIVYRFYTEATRVSRSDAETPEDRGYQKFCSEMYHIDNVTLEDEFSRKFNRMLRGGPVNATPRS